MKQHFYPSRRSWKRHSRSFQIELQKRRADKIMRRLQKKNRHKGTSDRSESRKDKLGKMFLGYKLIDAPSKLSLLNNEKETLDFLQELQDNFNERRMVAVLLDNVREITTDAIVVLLSNMVHYKAARIGFNGTKPNDSKVNAKLEASGFFKHLYGFAMPDQETYSFRKMSNYIYTHGQKTVDASLADELVKYASISVWGEARRCPGIQRTLVELMHNTYDHAGEEKGEKHWWISVEHDTQAHEVTFSFIDFGVGIFRSLENKKPGEPLYGAMDYIKQHFPLAKTQVDRLRLILEGKLVESQSSEYYRGKGLANTYMRFHKKQISDLSIISNYASIRAAQQDYHAIKNEFMGTFISFKMNKNTYSLKWEI